METIKSESMLLKKSDKKSVYLRSRQEAQVEIQTKKNNKSSDTGISNMLEDNSKKILNVRRRHKQEWQFNRRRSFSLKKYNTN